MVKRLKSWYKITQTFATLLLSSGVWTRETNAGNTLEDDNNVKNACVIAGVNGVWMGYPDMNK